MRITMKLKSEDEKYEKLKKQIKDCKPEEYEKAIKEICERLDY